MYFFVAHEATAKLRAISIRMQHTGGVVYASAGICSIRYIRTTLTMSFTVVIFVQHARELRQGAIVILRYWARPALAETSCSKKIVRNIQGQSSVIRNEIEVPGCKATPATWASGDEAHNGSTGWYRLCCFAFAAKTARLLLLSTSAKSNWKQSSVRKVKVVRASNAT
jgi:hypothetical protein